ncbi:NAD(P)/FAD-dependent oxidoreductase [Frankia sp. R82]|uniref:phytoene desaturase family protein n=1 Tax=Frankia sp. R82 TaxID=2950553 RepID=UPI002043BE75|nr:phytoene desaturase family protein [Frankia sp. R82]MCM3886417.1 phytoene desaturase family protein [Frankia sp. R82]
MARVVVIGAGVGGLATAARLAAVGHDVTICEQGTMVGGKLGWYERGGYGFDTGPSLLTMPHVFEDLFAATGGPPGQDELELRRLDPIASYRFADGTVLAAHADEQAFVAELDARLGAPAGADWQRLAARAARVFNASEQPFLASPVRAGGLARLAWAAPGDIPAVAPGRSLRGLGRSMVRDPRLRLMLDRYATYSGSDPRRAPAALVSVLHAERRFGGWYVPGGLHRLGAAVEARARRGGARILTGTRVRSVTCTPGGRVDGVRLADGFRLPADVVVANIDAAALYGGLLPEGLGRAGRRQVRRANRSMSGFVLLLALARQAPGPGPGRTGGQQPTGSPTRLPAQHTVTFPADYDAEFDAVFAGRLPADPTIYLHAPDDPACAPSDGEAWFVLVNAPPHLPSTGDPRPGRSGPRGPRPAGPGRDGPGPDGAGLDWDRPGLADGYARHVLELLAARGFDVRDRLRWYETITPADLERRTGSVGGAIYGTASHGVRSAFLRPPNATAVPGLFHVGGSAHPGGGLPLVALSAAIVAELVGPA